MNVFKDQVLEVVNDTINERLTQMIEDMSTNDFVEMVCDMIQDQKGIELSEEQVEEVQELIGSRVLPLLHKISEYIIGVDIPKE